MPRLTCPACKHRGEIRGTDEHFEPYGRWPDGHMPVRRCVNCGAGIIVRPRFLVSGAQGEQIPGDLWRKMRRHFEREMGTASAYECPDCGKGFPNERARDEHQRVLHA